MPPKTSGRGLAALYGKTIPKIKTNLLSERLNIIRQGSVDTFQARMEAVASLGKMTRKGAKEYRQYQEAKEFGDFEGGYFDYLKSPLEAQAARETAVSAIKEKRVLEKQEQEAMRVRDIRDKEQDALDRKTMLAKKERLHQDSIKRARGSVGPVSGEVEMAEDAKFDYPLNEYEAELIHGPPPEQELSPHELPLYKDARAAIRRRGEEDFYSRRARGSVGPVSGEVEMAEDAYIDPLTDPFIKSPEIEGVPGYAAGEATKIRDPRTGAWTESRVPETPYPYGRRIESGRGLGDVFGGGQPSIGTSYQAENLQNFNRPYSLENDPGYLPLREKILKQNELDRYEKERLREQSLFKRWRNPSQYGLGGSFEA